MATVGSCTFSQGLDWLLKELLRKRCEKQNDVASTQMWNEDIAEINMNTSVVMLYYKNKYEKNKPDLF